MQPTDAKTFEALFFEHYSAVCKCIYRIILDPDTAEDLGQVVFIKYWRKDLYRDSDHNPAAYLHRMAVNEAIDHLRTSPKNVQSLSEHPGLYVPTTEQTTTQYEQKTQNRAIWQAVSGLPGQCQLIFRLAKAEGLSYAEIAEYLDISVKTVENQMGRAFKLLREKLKDH